MVLPAPISFVVDCRSKKYLYVDPSCERILGNDQWFLTNAVSFCQSDLWHRNDFKVFNEHIFPDTIQFLKNNLKDHEDYSFSYNYRAQMESGEYRSLLQRSNYFVEQKTGLPLVAVGSLIDITHFKDDSRIIFTIEKTDKTALSKTPVVKKIYFPDKIYNVFTNRELEILLLMQEGLTSKTIAKKLFVSIHTINNHRRNMLTKTNCRNVSELFNYVTKSGLITK